MQNLSSPDAWYETPTGAFVLRRQQALIRHMLRDIPCHGQRLLELGCASGRFLEFFWELGFDVTGLDPQPVMLELARRRLAYRAELALGVPTHLPFDDERFDIVVIPALLDSVSEPAEVLAEALRVAASSVLFGFLNAWSLPGLLHTLPCPLQQRRLARPRSSLSYYSLAHALAPHARLSLATTLCAPACTWREGRWFRLCNRAPRLLPLGSFGLLRMDLTPPPAHLSHPLLMTEMPLQPHATASVLEVRSNTRFRTQPVVCRNNSILR